MIKTTNMMLEELHSYSNPKTKLSRMVKNGECYQIAKGLYETEKEVAGYLLAGSIYGPSYISFEYALGFYGMIPEAVYTITSATFEKKKKKRYQTAFGTFTYRDVPSSVFPFAIRVVQENGYSYCIAEPEKALCDKLYTLPPLKNTKELISLLYEDLRIETDSLNNLNIETIRFLSERYHSTNVKRLVKFLGRIRSGYCY